jgi:hypothetical protein
MYLIDPSDKIAKETVSDVSEFAFCKSKSLTTFGTDSKRAEKKSSAKSCEKHLHKQWLMPAQLEIFSRNQIKTQHLILTYDAKKNFIFSILSARNSPTGASRNDGRIIKT